ncbi:Catechol 2,3-dioxygenase [Faunimonas pinastri]|uniref:Bleomycin resistance protein n=1 Tax=Faunimonas pinastri TaxID=1855383 RepID=A0A1H9AXS0_9HYPH|nr:VOC family protein [Faunimonas pinastri]SEP81570.1 Catechol 2,3-dioxygenase [Faunimonas pinastri]
MTGDPRRPRLVPELLCSSLDESLRFYTELLGFRVRYCRPEERFAYLEREGAELMLEEPGLTRVWLTGPLQRPFGRGINLQIQIGDVDALYQHVLEAGITPFLSIEERWYRAEAEVLGNRQFIVQDPDGYLLRFYEDLGRRATG